jgi:transcriptional regulator with PAS, ATPase and Fis domain
MNYDFPGNIRELENIIERAFIVSEKNIILLEHLPGELLDKMDVTTPEDESVRYSMVGPENEIIKKTLEKYDGDRNMTARALHISRSTLWRKMKKYNITLDRR